MKSLIITHTRSPMKASRRNFPFFLRQTKTRKWDERGAHKAKYFSGWLFTKNMLVEEITSRRTMEILVFSSNNPAKVRNCKPLTQWMHQQKLSKIKEKWGSSRSRRFRSKVFSYFAKFRGEIAYNHKKAAQVKFSSTEKLHPNEWDSTNAILITEPPF